MLLNYLMVPGIFTATLKARKKSVPSLSLVGTLNAMGIHPRSVIDVGANAGQFTAACLAFYPDARVLAIEALPDLKCRLERLFQGYANVTVFGKGCGAQHEQRIFHVNEYDKSSSFLNLASRHKEAFPEATKTKDVLVEIMPLDLIIEQQSFEVPDLLKLDVQGFEMEVLKGAQKCLQGSRYIVMETSFTPLYEGERVFLDYVEFLAPYGFVFRGPVGFLTDPRSGAFLQMDALFERASQS